MEVIDLKEKNTEVMRVVFRFPTKVEADDQLKKEIKSILVSSLQEQLNGTTS